MTGRATSIVRRLVVLTVAVGLLTGSVGALLLERAEIGERRRAAGAGALAAADRTATLIDGRIDGLLAQLSLLASRPTVAELDPASGAELAVALRVSDDLDAIILYDRAGRPVAAASSVELLDPDQLPNDDATVALVRDGPSVRIVDPGPLPQLELAVPVEDPPGRLAGALLARAPVQLLTHEAEARLVSSDASGVLVDLEGRIVGHRDVDRVLARETFPAAATFSEGEAVTRIDPENDERGRLLVAAARSQQLPVWVVVEVPEAMATQRSETASNGTSLVVLAVVAAIVAVVIGATRRFLRPLRPLAEAVERLGAGERGVRVDDRLGSGEVRVLAGGFNRMAERLQQRQDELEDAERAARRSEERLRLLVEGVEDYAIFLLTRDGRVRSWNTGARRLLGATTDEASGRELSSFFDPDDQPEDPLLTAATTGRGESEGWCRRAHGVPFLGRTVVTALRDETDAPYGYAVVIQDLTDRQAARQATEEALEREQQAAEDLRRTNEVKDEFLAMAAHELQTPLAAIIGANEILREPDGLNEDERTQLRRVVADHALDMKGIVQRLLDFSRLQAGRVKLAPEQVELRAELEHQVDVLAHQLRDHEVVVDAPDDVVRIDRQSVRHIVGNLLSNAAKFSEPGSRIDVTGRVTAVHVAVSVTDHGIGIPEEDRDRIFELFGQSRTDRSSARGTGVGLAIVQRYADLLGGTVSLDTEVGRGSTFTVTVPVLLDTDAS